MTEFLVQLLLFMRINFLVRFQALICEKSEYVKEAVC